MRADCVLEKIPLVISQNWRTFRSIISLKSFGCPTSDDEARGVWNVLRVKKRTELLFEVIQNCKD